MLQLILVVSYTFEKMNAVTVKERSMFMQECNAIIITETIIQKPKGSKYSEGKNFLPL